MPRARPRRAGRAVIQHLLDLSQRRSQSIVVTLRVPEPQAEETVAMPVWTPGSYLVREFARHLSGLTAEQGGRELPLERVRKNAWRVRCVAGAGDLVLRYRVLAVDDSVRGSWLDEDRAFLNFASVCLWVQGRRDEAQRLSLLGLPATWSVATTLPRRRRGRGEASGSHHEVADYDALIDHPVEAGRFQRLGFDADGVPYELALTGAWPGCDTERLVRDLQAVARTVHRFWAPATPRPPFARYTVLLQLTPGGYGGLEHRDSCALQARRSDLPRPGQGAVDEGYATLLGLFAHELFHAWHVKRLRPAELTHIDLDGEVLTPLLWCFEGFTTYLEDLLVLRAGVVPLPQVLANWSKLASALAATPGRRVQSVADASREAWIKAYRPDAHSPNLTVSYYGKGALVAMALDAALRPRGRAIDDLLHALWRRAEGGAVDATLIAQALGDVLGPRRGLAQWRQLVQWVEGTDELPLPSLLAAMGLEWRQRPAPLARRLGLKLSEGPVTGVRVQQVLTGGAAAEAGLLPGDEVLAVQGWRVRRLDEALAWWPAQGPVTLTVVRDERLRELSLTLAPASAFELVDLLADPAASPGALRLRREWLGG